MRKTRRGRRLKRITRHQRHSRSQRRPSRRKVTALQKGGERKVYHFYNKYHYGDNIMNLYFFRAIKDHIKKNNSIVYYYYNTEYIKNPDELFRYVDPDTLVLLPLHTLPNDAVELWHANPIDGVNAHQIEKYYNLFYKKILDHMGIKDDSINLSLFQDQPYLEEVYNKLNNKYKDADVLIINAKAVTEAVAFDEESFKEVARNLAKKCKVVTTEKVDDITSTRDDGLKIQDIGAIATRAKYIIAMHTGPITACFSKQAKEHVKRWFIVATNNFYFNEIPNEFYSSSKDLKGIESKIVI